jgi:hypothetical protein
MLFPKIAAARTNRPERAFIDQTYSLTLRLPASSPAGAPRGRALLLRRGILPAAEKQVKLVMFMVNTLLSRRG